MATGIANTGDAVMDDDIKKAIKSIDGSLNAICAFMFLIVVVLVVQTCHGW